MHFVSLFSGEFATMALINPPERKLEKHTSVQWVVVNVYLLDLVMSSWKVNIVENPFISNLKNISPCGSKQDVLELWAVWQFSLDPYNYCFVERVSSQLGNFGHSLAIVLIR